MTDVATAKAPGVRARVRAALTAEIKASARRQLVTDGPAALSLRAIARELDMASSAIYRYFASRDELLTALIIDAYNAVGAAVEEADAEHERSNYRGRLIAVGQAARSWAVSNPQEYGLIYGSPVPGYKAPPDTIDPAVRVPTALITVFVEYFEGDEPVGPPAAGDELGAALLQLSEFTEHRLTPSQLACSVQAWGEILGLVSLELFGHFHNAVTDPAHVFSYSMEQLADRTMRP